MLDELISAPERFYMLDESIMYENFSVQAGGDTLAVSRAMFACCLMRPETVARVP